MGMRKILLASSVLLLACVAAAAQEFNLSGVVSTPDTSSREWGVCYISSGADKVASYKFTVGETFHWTLRAPGAYSLSFVMPGYVGKSVEVVAREGMEDIGLGDIRMLGDEHLLDASTVSAEGTRLYFDRESVTLDVAGDSLLRRKSLKDVIARLPMVVINRESNSIELSSGNSFAVTVNGRKNLALSGSNIDVVSDFLKGENVKSVTINTAPVGRYGSYAAVIDIRTERDLSDFIVERVGLNASGGYSAGMSGSITLKAGKAVVEASYRPSYKYARESYRSSVRTSLADPLVEYAAHDTVKTSKGWGHDIGLNASYDIGDKDVLFLTSGFNRSSSSGTSTSSFRDGFTETASDLGSSDCNVSLSYQHDFKSGREKLLTLQAGMNDRRSNNRWDVNGTLSDNDTRAAEYNVGVDFSHSVSNRLSYYANGGWFYRDYGSKSGGDVLLDYPQSILFCGGNVAYRLGKFRLTGKGKYEHTDDIKSYNSANYALGANWFPRPGQMLSLSVSQDIYRADFAKLNAFEDNTVLGTTVVGNPSSGMTRSNAVTLMYSYMIGGRFAVRPMFAYRTNEAGALSKVVVRDDGSIVSSYAAYDCQKGYRFSTGMSWNDPDGRFNIMLNPLIAKNVYESAEGTVSNIEWALFFNVTARLWGGVYMYAFGHYANPDFTLSFDPQATRLHNLFRCNVGLSKSFGRWHASLTLDRPWQAREKSVREIEASGYKVVTTTMSPVNRISIGVLRSFGRLKEDVKRNRRIIEATDHLQ